MNWQNIINGNPIPAQHYADQPYLVKTDDGHWLCCLTTGGGDEGAAGQHIQMCRSNDFGKTWKDITSVEEPGAVENSYAVMLKAPSGRIFVFYNRNSDNVREIMDHGRTQKITRVDCLGDFGFKYSDDHGKTWSKQFYNIPYRHFQCDRDNIYQGKIRFFWNVGRPFALDNTAYVSLIRVGEMGKGFYQKSEGSLLKSANLLTVADPDEALWETLPDGDLGLKTPPGGGPIAEEQCFVALSDGSLYVTYRSIDGYPVEAYSRDGGHTWSVPRYMKRANGHAVKHPRAANFVWKCNNGKYLYWFHNHGGHFVGGNPQIVYEDRNPAWLLPGVEADSPEGKIIRWGEPELLFYHPDPMVRMSYPDLLEDDNRYFITETEKNLAKVHEVPATFLQKMWDHLEGKEVKTDAEVLLSVHGPAKLEAPPKLPPFSYRNYQLPNHAGSPTNNSFTLEFVLTGDPQPGLLLNGRQADGRGVSIEVTAAGQIILTLDDGCEECRLRSQKFSPEELVGAEIAVNVDGKSSVVSFVRNGVFADGGEELQFGWRRFDNRLVTRPNHAPWEIGSSVKTLTVYAPVLHTCEC